jgi:hypothetical protein
LWNYHLIANLLLFCFIGGAGDTVFCLKKKDSCVPSHVCNFFGDLNLPIRSYEPGLSVNGGQIKLIGRSVAPT